MKRLLVLCGGKSAEHEISLKTAKNILNALDRNQFSPVLVGVSRSGTWYYLEDESCLQDINYIDDVYDVGLIACLVKFPGYACLSTQKGVTIAIDVALPLFHGPNGEDGTIQGLLDLCSVPYVGSGVLSSAVGMDKDIFKQILAFHHIPVTPSLTLDVTHPRPTYHDLRQMLGGDVFFIKPACMGSSVGVSKVRNAAELDYAIDNAFEYSHKILIEKGIEGREIECAVLGNLHPKASILGEICSNHDFYSYEAKYIDPNGAGLIIPASLGEDITQKIQEISLQVFKAINCRGLARVDFFLTSAGQVYVNELNTFPGFTNISMYPKLWQESGVSYPDLISTLISLAIEEFEVKKNLKVDVDLIQPELEIQHENLAQRLYS